MGILAMGGGASTGLETLLKRMMDEDEQDRRGRALDETIRSNKADEGLRGQYNSEIAASRNQAQASLAQSRTDANADRDAARTLTRLNMRPIGSHVPDEEVADDLKAGASRSNYDWKPGTIGLSTIKEEKPAEESGYSWKGTPPQIEAAKDKQTAGMQRDTQLYNGKPTDVLVDTRSNKVFLIGGEDVTGKTQHYEKPPGQDRVLIQSGDSWVPRSDALARARNGEDVPLPTTGSTRTMQEGAQMLQPHVSKLASTAEELDRRGMFGPVMSRIRDLAVKAGTTLESGDPEQEGKAWQALGQAIADDPQIGNDRLAGRFATELGLMTSGAGRVHGGARGGGSIQMITYLKSLVSSSSTLPMFLGRLDALDGYLGSYAQGPQKKGGAEKPDDNDPLGLGLGKPKL